MQKFQHFLPGRGGGWWKREEEKVEKSSESGKKIKLTKGFLIFSKYEEEKITIHEITLVKYPQMNAIIYFCKNEFEGWRVLYKFFPATQIRTQNSTFDLYLTHFYFAQEAHGQRLQMRQMQI